MFIGLQNYRLDFLTKSLNWNGCSATIVEDDGSNVWGAVWEINISNMKDLDRLVLCKKSIYNVINNYDFFADRKALKEICIKF